jgi:hypothetical protein
MGPTAVMSRALGGPMKREGYNPAFIAAIALAYPTRIGSVAASPEAARRFAGATA